MRRVLLVAVAVVAVSIAVLHVVRRPSNDRDWSPDQRVLAYADLRPPYATVHNVRFCTYRTTSDYTCTYSDRAFDLRKLESVWFVVEPFGASQGAAHTFVSFGFGGGEYVAISIEVRKEKGESFSAVRGLLREYELMYVIADERDVIKLRSNYRRDPVYLYPVRTTRARAQRMFVEMLQRTNQLRSRPEFYDTLTNNCTTNIVHHVNTIVPGRVPFTVATVLPGYSDRLAYRLGLIDTDLPFDAARERFRINERAATYANDPAFSDRIRQ